MVKGRKLISWFLIMVSIIMLTASTMPHHHHHDRICLQHDLTEDTSCSGTSQESSKQNSCEICCVTKFKCSVPDNQNDIQPHFTYVLTLFTETVVFGLLNPDEQTHQYNSYYYESLHSARVTRSIGLRAPPALA